MVFQEELDMINGAKAQRHNGAKAMNFFKKMVLPLHRCAVEPLNNLVKIS
jgi:hypothetical protein